MTEIDQEFDEAFGEGEQPEDGAGAADELETGGDEPGENTDDKPGEEPDLAAQLEEARRAAQEWEHRYKSDSGRFQAAQRALQQPQQMVRDVVSEALKDPEKWTALKGEYPEIAEAVEARDNVFTERIRQSVLQEIQEPLSRLKQREKDLERQTEEAALAAQHPDWREVSSTAEFDQWLSKQPQAVQQMQHSDYAADAAYLVGTFKATRQAADVSQRPVDDSTERIVEQRKRKLLSAQTVPQKGAASTGLPKDDFDEVFSAIT